MTPDHAPPTTHHAPPTQDRLARVLGVWLAMAIVIGNTIGSGVFKKPAVVAQNVPTTGWALSAWVLMGSLVLCGGLAMSEVTVLFPRAGGNYVFLREGYGRLFGFLWGWVEFFVIRSASIAALADVFTESLHDVLQHPACRTALGLSESGPVLSFWGRHALTALVILLLALVNARGVRWGAGLGFAVTTVKVGSLLFIAVLPFALALAWTSSPLHWDHLTAPSPRPFAWGGYGAALVGVLWAYHGWMNLGPVAEEIREPQRNIPRAQLGGIGVVLALYVAANVAYALVLDHDTIAGCKNTPVAAEFSRQLLGPTGGLVVSVMIAFSVFGALNGNLLVGPRLLFAMADDRLAPRSLAAVHPRYGTPAVATLVLAAWSIVLVLGLAALLAGGWIEPGKAYFDYITDFAMFGAVAFETMAVASIFVFRWKYPDRERPYRCVGYPVVPAVYVACFAAVLVNMFTSQRTEALTGTGFALTGAAVYGLFLRRPAPAE
jgi:amino acid transporter